MRRSAFYLFALLLCASVATLVSSVYASSVARRTWRQLPSPTASEYDGQHSDALYRRSRIAQQQAGRAALLTSALIPLLVLLGGPREKPETHFSSRGRRETLVEGLPLLASGALFLLPTEISVWAFVATRLGPPLAFGLTLAGFRHGRGLSGRLFEKRFRRVSIWEAITMTLLVPIATLVVWRWPALHESALGSK